MKSNQALSSKTREQCFHQYSLARYSFEHLDEQPDTPWIIDDYINSILALCDTLDFKRKKFLLLKSYRTLLNLIRDKQQALAIRQYALNQVYRLLDALHCCLASNEPGRYEINLLHNELKSVRIEYNE